MFFVEELALKRWYFATCLSVFSFFFSCVTCKNRHNNRSNLAELAFQVCRKHSISRVCLSCGGLSQDLRVTSVDVACGVSYKPVWRDYSPGLSLVNLI